MAGTETISERAEMRGPLGMRGHPLLPRILGEIHSRPFQLVQTPRSILQLAFLIEAGDFAPHVAALSRLVEMRGGPPQSPDIRHVLLDWGAGRLRWERHTEFTTWAFDAPAGVGLDEAVRGHPFGEAFAAPGPVISAARLDIRPSGDEAAVIGFFDPTSLSFSEMDGGLALAASDFRQDGDSLTRIVVIDRGLGPARAGALTQRLLEIETYRTLALLGLPEAQRLGPELSRVEGELVRITASLQSGAAPSAALLDELIALSAELEAKAVATLYRFGASRAYDEIVTQRLDAVGETAISGYETWTSFLSRRLAPAMRTCWTVQERQESLSEKLARGADLLRTRVDVELEHQNRDLLQSMNRRAHQQLRLQQTVEGLSVAAITYYVVGLIAYVAKGAQEAGAGLDSGLLTAASVPIVALLVAWTVRRIRRRDGDG
jgi:uncharacterized membrane-anchored protein